MILCLFITKLGHGGAERVATNIANEWAQNGRDEVHVILTYDTEKAYKLHKNIKVHVLPFASNHFIRIIRRIISVHNLLKTIKPHVVVSVPEGTSPYVAIDRYFNRSYKAVFSQRQDPELEYKTKFKKWLGNFAFRKADAVVFQTEMQKSFFPEDIQQKGTIILNPVTENLPYRNENEINHDIVSFCRLEKEKNLELLIDSFEEISKKYQKFTLKIWGKGSEEENLKITIKERHLEEKIILMGYSNNIHEDIKNAFMYINSSNHEGISNAMMESMAIGLPVVCTNCPCGGAEMVIQNEVNGMLVPVNDSKKMTEAMEKIIVDESMRRTISENGVQIRNTMNQTYITGLWTSVIQNLFNEGA